MGDTWQDDAGQGRSRFSKALPVPPNGDTITRGKANPFPSTHRALPPTPKSNTSSAKAIPRRPVGGQPNSKEPSIASLSPTYSESPKMPPNYQSFVAKDTMESERSPLPPPKDKDTRQLPDIPQEPSHLHTNSTSSTTSANSSSPRSEIWRRRSVKSDRSVNISDLKLTKSNGSTANPPSLNASSLLPASKDSLPPLPTQTLQPTRTVAGLPGRSIKPARPAPQQPDAMGSKITKLVKPERKDSLPRTDNTRTAEIRSVYQLSPIKRLPTPDYLSTDKSFQQSSVPQVLSPVSPQTPPSDSSPELGNILDEYISSSDLPKDPNHLKLLPSVRASEQVETTNQKSRPGPSQPQKPDLPSILTIKRPPSRTTAISQPEATLQKSAEIFPSAALSVVHFNCYQSHRQMRVSRNDFCPLGCMICEVKDTEKRWMCTWCSLRCCDPCMKGLASIPGKDLGKCLEWIGRKDRMINMGDVSNVS